MFGFKSKKKPPDIKTLMVVLRESEGMCKTDEILQPVGHMTTTLSDGQKIEKTFAWYSLIGDMHIRFVYDSKTTMINLAADEFEELKLNPNEALKLAVQNIKNVYGVPQFSPWLGGVMEVAGKCPDLDSSYFLDREFWLNLLNKYSEGLVVAVPKRGGLLFAPLSDTAAVDGLKKSIAMLYSTSEHLRVSSALYLFSEGRWSVFQDPLRQ